MFKRGFKSWSESISGLYRKELGLAKEDPIDVFALAWHLKIAVRKPEDFNLPKNYLDTLLKKESDVWSAVTLCQGLRHLVIYNSSNAPTRRPNDIMHEIAHIIIGHEPQGMHSFDANIVLRHYDKEKEMEADHLAGTLLLPMDALMTIKKSGTPVSVAAKQYMVSETLLNMRLNLSGANKIYQRSQSKYGALN